MKLFEFISAISFMTLVFGIAIKLIMTIPFSLGLALKESEKTLFWLNAVVRILITSIIAYYILQFTNGMSLANSLGFYISGFYFYMVLFTLNDETEKETIQENQKTYSDYIILKAASLNPFLIVVALIYYILAIVFPVLTNFYIPSFFSNLYNWLFSFTIISWIIYLLGAFSVFYTIQYTFVFIISIIRGLFKFGK